MVEENQRSVQENNTVTLQVLSSHHRHPVALSRRDFSFQAFNLRRKAYLESRKSARVRYYNHKALRRGLTRGYMPVNTVEKGSGEDATTLRVLDEIGIRTWPDPLGRLPRTRNPSCQVYRAVARPIDSQTYRAAGRARRNTADSLESSVFVLRLSQGSAGGSWISILARGTFDLGLLI